LVIDVRTTLAMACHTLGRTFYDFWFEGAHIWDEKLDDSTKARLVQTTVPQTVHEITGLKVFLESILARDFFDRRPHHFVHDLTPHPPQWVRADLLDCRYCRRGRPRFV